MKNQIILTLCCLVLVVSGMAQPKTGRISEKIAEKFKNESLNKKKNLEKEKLGFFQRQTSLPQMQNPAKFQKGVDWWEPDTVFVYCTDDSDQRRIFSYENGKCSIDLTQEWNNNQWGNLVRYTYKYDSQNNMTEELGQIWQSGQWVDGFKYTYSYNSQNNMTSSVMQFWQSGQWTNISKGTFSYDLQNNMEEEIWQSWGGQWVNEDRSTHTYDPQNNLLKTIYQGWESGKWENLSNENYTYNAQNDYIEILYQLWKNSKWEDYGLQTFYYNDLNQCTSYIFQYWKNNGWKNEDKVVLTYDVQNNMTSETWQSWWGDVWENFGKSTCSYDENNNATSGFSQYWSGNIWVDGDGLLYVYYNNMQSLNLMMFGQRFTATYVKPCNIGIKENNLLNNSVLLYPNPVSNILHIETNNAVIPEIKIYSIQGVLLINTKGKQIDVSSLPSGIYIAEIDGVRQKIVKQ
ncbi:MAG: T9SS type A sorting domain-containing protein [Firmicutes bacterium]|nr:T9SS type A sorting domain-containing protein [Bacillota bacterium]